MTNPRVDEKGHCRQCGESAYTVSTNSHTCGKCEKMYTPRIRIPSVWEIDTSVLSQTYRSHYTCYECLLKEEREAKLVTIGIVMILVLAFGLVYHLLVLYGVCIPGFLRRCG